MQVAVAQRLPVAELDPQLEGRLGLLDELDLVDAQQTVEELDRRDGGLADPDRADLLGFDEFDLGDLALERLGQCGGGHPAGRAPADDDELEGRLLGHGADFPSLGHTRRLAASPAGATNKKGPRPVPVGPGRNGGLFSGSRARP
jgi:hypothetical protein